MQQPELPIEKVLPDLVEALDRQRGVVLVAPTGAGKTTQVPQAVLDADLLDDDQRVLVLEPRRVAARATARRIAEERGGDIGGEVGYQVRFDRRVSSETRLVVMTEGILTRRLQDDPFLEGVGAVLLDEFHERSIHSDLAIAFLKELFGVREDLLVGVMSATITAEPIADYLDVPVVESEGRTHPVDVEYLGDPAGPDRDQRDVERRAARAVRRGIEAPEDDGGDILVFMPGASAIHRTIDVLESMPLLEDVEIVPLYGALAPEKQDAAIEPSERRKVIVSTNIAETSLTIEGVTTVVDSGLVKRMRMAPESGLDRLEQTDVSRASAEQRAGRAGRTRPGRAYRLWTRAHEHQMAEEETPEILRVDVTGPVLEVVAWSRSDPREFDWFEAPPEHALDRAVELLRQLGALEAGGFSLTDVGERMLDFPAHPRLARMLLEAEARGCVDRVAGMAAILSERDFILSVDEDAPAGAGDLQLRAELLEEVADGRQRRARGMGMETHVGRARRTAKVKSQLAGRVERGGEPDRSIERPASRAVAAGFPDRICFERGEGRHYTMVGGEPLALAYESVVREAECLVAPVIAGETRGRGTGGVESRALIRKAESIELEDLEELFDERFCGEVEAEFDDEREQVMAFERLRFDDVLLSESVASVDDELPAGDVSELLVDAAAEQPERALELGDEQLRYLARIECVRRWRPELELPELRWGESEMSEDFAELLRRIAWGKRSFRELRELDLVSELRGQLTHHQIEAVRELAPASVKVPSGATHRLDYEPGEPPVLEVRIQEMFGAEAGPTVAGGEVPVMLHLLAPNFRPAQITDDLESFWENTYPEVKKEMKARYPKHPWPDAPREAEAVAM